VEVRGSVPAVSTSVDGSKMGDEESSDIATETIWENARAYASLLGVVPSSFSSLVRLLVRQGSDISSLDFKTIAQTERLLKGPTSRSMFFFCAKTFRELELDNKSDVTLRELVAMFSPFDLASLISLLYLYRRSEKLCKDDEAWASISSNISSLSEIGGYVGDAIPSIGLGTGLFVGCLREIALCTVGHHDPAGYQAYIRHLQDTKQELDLDFELQRWSTSSLQIASTLLQSMGFGVDMSEGIVFGLDPRVSIAEITDDASYRLKITRVWIDSMLETGEQPTISLRGEYYPLKEAMDRLQVVSKAVQSDGPRFSWLTADPESLGDASPMLINHRRSCDTSSQASTEPELSKEEEAQLNSEIDDILSAVEEVE
jgi:hypothetical protein